MPAPSSARATAASPRPFQRTAPAPHSRASLANSSAATPLRTTSRDPRPSSAPRNFFERLVQPPARRRPRREFAFLFRPPHERRDHRTPARHGRPQSGVVRQPQVAPHPQNGCHFSSPVAPRRDDSPLSACPPPLCGAGFHPAAGFQPAFRSVRRPRVREAPFAACRYAGQPGSRRRTPNRGTPSTHLSISLPAPPCSASTARTPRRCPARAACG